MFMQDNSGVAHLIFIDAGMFQPLYRRPLEMHITQDLVNVVSEVTQGGSVVGSANLAGAASNVLRPSADPAQLVDINGGWNQRRLRFVLRMIVHQTPQVVIEQYYSGYTDYTDPSFSGLLDPNMRLHFNSTMQVRETYVMTPFGVQPQRQVNDSSQILSGSYTPSQIITPFMQPGAVAGEVHHSMRPGDIFLRMQANTRGLGPSDTRTMFAQGVKKVSRDDSLAPNYLSRAIKGWRDVMRNADYEQDSLENLFDETSTKLSSPLVTQDPLLGKLQKHSMMQDGGSYLTANSVTLGELRRLYPNVDGVTEIVQNRNYELMSQQFNGMDAANWHGRTMEHIAGTIIAESLPALMLTHMVQKFSFKATNKLPVRAMGESPDHIVVTDARSVAQLTDMTEPVQHLIDDIRRQLVPQVSHGGMMPYDITVEADVFGQTVMHIDLGNGITTLVMPSFADSLASTLIAPQDQYLDNLASGMNFLVDTIAGSPQGNLQNMMHANALANQVPEPAPQTFGNYNANDHEAYAPPLRPLY